MGDAYIGTIRNISWKFALYLLYNLGAVTTYILNSSKLPCWVKSDSSTKKLSYLQKCPQFEENLSFPVFWDWRNFLEKALWEEKWCCVTPILILCPKDQNFDTITYHRTDFKHNLMLIGNTHLHFRIIQQKFRLSFNSALDRFRLPFLT